MTNLDKFKAVHRVLGSYDEARAGVSFAVRIPTFLPTGMQLYRITHVLPNWVSNGQDVQAGFLDFYYRNPAARLAITQGYTSQISVAGVPDGLHGQTTVNGAPALWVDGHLEVDQPMPDKSPFENPTARWKRGLLTLSWPGAGLVAYRLQGEGLSLDDLVRTAESLS